MQCRIREFQPEDVDALARIFRGAILELGEEYYSPEQVTAWASFSDDADEFRAWVSDAMTLIAVDGDECLGFGSLQPQGRISALFVAPEYSRRGVASKLLAHLLQEAGSRGFEVVTAEASEFSRPLFGKFGFSVREVEHTRFRGVDFTRYAMRARIQCFRRG